MLHLCFSRGFWMAALTVMLVVLSPPLALARDTPPHFLFLVKDECHFFNGTERVRLLQKQYYNGEEHVRFDTGRPDAKYWNSQKDLLEQMRAAVDTYCRHNYRILDTFLVPRRGERGECAAGGRGAECV
uniref:MHC class II beta chain N-terminal domain-containing protein n=1 Tax=Sus scrofa TaxID=9823 RepID=A0A4X1TLB6_PIG